MAKSKANIKRVASAGGVKAPPKPRGPKPDQLKKRAKQQAKARMKRVLRVALVLLLALIVAFVVYMVKFHGRQPKDALKKVIAYAYEDKSLKFRDMFTSDSIEMVERGRDSSEPWERLIDGITPVDKPKIVSENKYEQNGIDNAELVVKIDDEDRIIHMRREDGAWKVNLNVAIDPRRVELPTDIPPEYVENFQVSDENEAWWEDVPKAEEEAEKEKGAVGRFFSKITRGGKRLFF